jgi:serine/threonine protein kinase
MNREVAGEGGFGCVLKPSLHCITQPSPKFKYNNYVSKIMKTKNAKTELKEFEIIGALDPSNEYHLGKPFLCRPNLHEKNVRQDIDKCKRIKYSEIEADPTDYSLLVLEDGGPDLKSLCMNHLSKYLSTFKQQKTDKFWLEVYHLLKGLQFFKEHGMVHYDIKPQNILFDLKNGSMKYIDFGLMKTKAEIIDKSKNSKNNSAIFHWSYPLDCGFMNKDVFDLYKNFKNRSSIKKELTDMIVSDSKINNYDLPIRKPQAFKVLFTYLNPKNEPFDTSVQSSYINSFFKGFNLLLDHDSYNQILDRFTDSIDIFGLGFTLQYLINCFKRHDAVSLEDYNCLSAFFSKMYDFNPYTRVLDLDQLLNEYENILIKMGVLTRLHKKSENYRISQTKKKKSKKHFSMKNRSKNKSRNRFKNRFKK